MKKNYLFTLVLMFAFQMFWAQVTVTTTAAFSTCAGTASAPQIIAVSDPLPLTTSLTVTAPTGFEVKKVSDSNYSASLTIARNSGILGAIPSTQLHIRLKSDATGSPSGNVTFVRGVQTTNMAVSGTVNAVPATPTITASGLTTFCAGGSVTLTAPSSTGYVWSTGETSRSITVTTAGTYSVTVSNASGCTASSTGRVVTVNELPLAPSISTVGSTTFCQGENVVLTSSYATGNTWSNGANTQSITVSNAGMYSVTTTNMNGCKSTSSTATTISVNALAKTPAITTKGNATVCAGETVVLNCDESASPSSTYTWYKDGNEVEREENSRTLSVTESGMYTVVVNNGVCNSLPSPARKVTVNPIPKSPTISTSGTTTLCAGKTVTLTSSVATGNRWSTGANTQSIIVSTAGTYTVTATNLSCTSPRSEGVTVTVNAIPTRPTITASGATTLCTGGDVTFTSSSATGNLWSNGETTPSITVSRAGTYSVSTINEGCSSTPSLGKTVIVNTAPTSPTISVVGSTNLVNGGSVLLTSSYATSNTWSTGAKTRSITVTTPGTYSVSFASATCTSAPSQSVTVTQNSNPE